jgi:hypothetical protein
MASAQPFIKNGIKAALVWSFLTHIRFLLLIPAYHSDN